MKKHYIIGGAIILVLVAVLVYLHFHNKKKDAAERYPAKGKSRKAGVKNTAASSSQKAAGIMETDPGMSVTPLDTSVIMDSHGGHSIMPKDTNVNTGNPVLDVLNVGGL